MWAVLGLLFGSVYVAGQRSYQILSDRRRPWIRCLTRCIRVHVLKRRSGLGREAEAERDQGLSSAFVCDLLDHRS